jgi:hypothetical protein
VLEGCKIYQPIYAEMAEFEQIRQLKISKKIKEHNKIWEQNCLVSPKGG